MTSWSSARKLTGYPILLWGGDEDKSLQDYLHALEFTDNKYDMHNEALKLWQSRKARRRHKDIMLLNKEIAEIFRRWCWQEVFE